MNKVIPIPLTRNQLNWILLIGFPVLIILTFVHITIYQEASVISAALLAFGIMGSLIIWVFNIIDWYDDGIFGELRFKDDD